MEFSFNGFSIKINKEDIGFIFEQIKNPVKKIVKSIKESVIKEYSICLIDYRYETTKYITEYGKVKISIKTFYDIVDNFQIIPNQMFHPIFLEDIFKKDVLIQSSGELNGYESDTPDINSFDFILRL